MLFDFDEEANRALFAIRWPATVAAIGVLVSLVAVTGALWYVAVRRPCPFGELIDLDPYFIAASVALAVIEVVFFLLTRRPPRSRLVGVVAAVVLAVTVWFVVVDVVGIVEVYTSTDVPNCWTF